MSNLQETNTKHKSKINSKTKKLIMIIITAALMMIPISYISDIIQDRENHCDEAIKKVENSWAQGQIITPPALYFKDKKNQKFELNNYNVNVKVKTEIRKKGIFKIPVYTADFLITGDFTNNYGNLSQKNLILNFKVSDPKGFIKDPTIKIANQLEQKVSSTSNAININSNSKTIPFEITYQLKGTESIRFDLKESNSIIDVESNWKKPEFYGNYLPNNRKITSKGFNSHWSIPKSAIQAEQYNTIYAAVKFLSTNNSYTMAQKSLKYCYLLILLSFLCYYIFEITSKEENKIHPIQYSLLGAAILIFYLLLISISEFLSFGFAYLISTLMVLTMIFLYTHYVIVKNKNLEFAIGTTALTGMFYLFFYILLSLDDMALLAGSLMLFITIGCVMYFTRNVDWYGNS